MLSYLTVGCVKGAERKKNNREKFLLLGEDSLAVR